MRRPMFALIVLLTVTGCQANALLAPPSQHLYTPNDAPPSRVGALSFKSVSAATAQQLATSFSPSTASAVAPQAAMATGVGAASSASVAVASPYAYANYFGGPFGQMQLTSTTEADAAGASGDWTTVQAQAIAPVLAAWDPHAKLLSEQVSLDAQGNVTAGDAQTPGQGGWHVSYGSTSLNEVLEFTITAQDTHVLRLHWTPNTLDPSAVTVDAKTAVAKLTAAITDPHAKSKEEQLGHDVFFGQDATVGMGIAQPAVGAPAGVGIAQSAVAVAPAPVAISPPASSVPEPSETPWMPVDPVPPLPIYTVAPGGTWNADLEAIGTYLVWNLTYTPPQGKSDMNVDNFCSGMIDAKTGDVLRLQRPQQFVGGVSPGLPVGAPMMPANATSTTSGVMTPASPGATPNGKL